MKKLHGRKRILLYSVAGMGINMLNLMVGSYLCSALLIGGFGETDISYQTFAQQDLVIASLWAVFAFAAKILDGVIDIPLASLTDRMKTRWGRRRPSILIGLIGTVISYLLFLVVPQVGASIGNTIWYGIILCLFYCAYTLTMVTYYATFTEVVDTVEERNLLSNAKSVWDIVYFILGYVVVRMLLNGLNIRLVALIVLPLAVTMLIPLFMLKESSTDATSSTDETTETVHLLESLKLTLRDRSFVIWMVVYACMTFGVQLFLGGINEYFSYVGMNMIIVMVAAFLPVPLTLMLYNRLIGRFGFRFAFRYILLIYSAAMILMGLIGFMPDNTLKLVLALLTGLLCSFAIGALFSVAYSIPSQLAADEEKRTGISHSAMYFAVQGLFSGVASGIATGLVLTALKKASENIADGPMKYMTFIAAAGCLAACAFTSLLPRSIVDLGKKRKN